MVSRRSCNHRIFPPKQTTIFVHKLTSIFSGTFSVVRECHKKDTNEHYAIKTIRKKTMKELFLLENEVKIMQEMSHPNIIKLIDVYETEEELCLIMEL